MNHTKSLLIKFIASFILFYIILGMIYGMSVGDVFLISLVLGVVSYIIGDLFILRKSNNFIATLADFGLAYMVIRLMSDGMIDQPTNLVQMSLLASAGVALFEYFFHKYFADNVLSKEKKEENRTRGLQYQTEASEEFTPDVDKKNENDGNN